VIRFLPDSWTDVVMRPLDMISPEANIYVEVAAPDLRLAAVLLLGVVVVATSARKRADARPGFYLLALLLLAMVPWFLTTGNGRYFIPFLLLLGPLCVGLVRLLPLSRSLKFSVAGLLLASQGFLIAEASPWGAWSLASWQDGTYFQVAKPPQEPRSYVTLTPISYSLIAPQFPPESRWMSGTALVAREREREYQRKWLTEAKSLYLVAPSLPSQMDADEQPSAGVLKVFNELVAHSGVSVVEGARCDFLPSGGLVSLAMRHASDDPVAASRHGFWLCPARYDPAAAIKVAATPKDPAVEAVFAAAEKQCPRFFPAGEAQTYRHDDGASRHYTASDTRIYVMDNGEVLYRFWRSINPVTIGTRAAVLDGSARLDCTKIRAGTWRTGGP
jgi:hypothetical protein